QGERPCRTERELDAERRQRQWGRRVTRRRAQPARAHAPGGAEQWQQRGVGRYSEHCVRTAPRHGLPDDEDSLGSEEQRQRGQGLAPRTAPAGRLTRQPERRQRRRHPALRRTRKEAALMSGTDTNNRDRVRLYATGSCEGFDKLRESLASHPEIELVGSSVDVAGGAAALAGGHLDAVLHATRSTALPADELSSIRQHTQAPVLIVASS